MLEQTLGRWISQLHRYGRIFIARELEPYAIGQGQAPFLIALYHKDGICQDELAQLLKIDKGATARAISKLEQAGYVRRETSREDLRCNRIYLTARALELKPKLSEILQRWSDIISTGLTKEEMEQAFTLLEKMAHNACRYIEKMRNQ
jgi:DNA-binding MarR family transcriptional regulator